MTARRRASPSRMAVALAILALLLQSSALLLHHTLRPHHHQLAAMVPGGVHHEHGQSTPDRSKPPSSCPVWTALQQISGGPVGLAPPLAILLVFALVVLAGAAPLPPRRSLILSAPPRR
jgi:hypothetical protein